MKRKQKDSILIICEGDDDQYVLEHFRRIYTDRRLLKVDVIPAGGGSVGILIKKAENFLASRDYNSVYAVFDTDREEWLDESSQDDLVNKAGGSGISCFPLGPLCLEGFLLSVLNVKAESTSQRSKSKLYKRFDIRDKSIQKLLSRLDKSLLERRRREFELLDELLNIFECAP